MSHLLGNEECLKNLREDVNDISGVLSEILSRTGPLTVSSWKFPDTAACELDVVELLDRYSFSEDELDNQVSHFSLLELVVDRLLLVLHCAAAFHDQISSASGVFRAASASSTSDSKTPAPTSAGLIVKKFWLKIVKIFTAVSQLQSECASAKREKGQMESRVNELNGKISDLKDQVEKVSASRKAALAIAEEIGNAPSVTQNSSLKVAVEALAAARPTPCPHIGNDFSQRGCQTLDTSFAPCGACHEAQAHIRLVVRMAMDRWCFLLVSIGLAGIWDSNEEM